MNTVAAPMVSRSRFFSTTVEPPRLELTPPPNMSDTPPPLPACKRMNATSVREEMRCRTTSNAVTRYFLDRSREVWASVSGRDGRRPSRAPPRSGLDARPLGGGPGDAGELPRHDAGPADQPAAPRGLRPHGGGGGR